MKWDKAKLALLVLGVVVLCELVLIGILAATGTPIPDQAWSLAYATIGILAGVAGAQTLNGRIAKAGG